MEENVRKGERKEERKEGRKRIESDKPHARSEHVGLGEQEDRSDQDLARYIGESAEPLLSDIKKTDDHASLGDEDTEQNRPKAGALQAYELWMATFAHWEGTKSRLKPGVLAVLPWERGVRHGC